MAMLKVRCGTFGVASHPVPCTSLDVQKPSASKTEKVKFTFKKKLSTLPSDSSGFFYAKSRTRIGCWNVRSLGSLSDQSAQLHSVIETLNSRNMNLLTLFVSCWPGSGATHIHGTTILHFDTPSSHTHGVAILLHPRAKVAWEAAGSVFQLVSECILIICLKCHLSYMSVLSIYAPTNPSNSTFKSADTSDATYDQLQSTLSYVPASDLLVIMGNFDARVGSYCSFWNSVMGPHSIGKCNENGKRLLDFCANNHMIVSNTWFQHKLLHQAAWF